MNAMLRFPKEIMEALRFEDVQLYLMSRNWKLDQAASRPGTGLFRLPGEPDAEILLPLRRDWADYALRMGDVVTTLAAVEQRSVWAVLNDLSGPPADVLRLRLVAPDAALGNVPLEEGLKLFKGGREMLAAAACSAYQPQPFFLRKSYQPAIDFLKSCRLGQTERGSFVATILAPVPPVIEEQTIADFGEDYWLAQEPYARRVTLQLMSGLSFILQSIQASMPERIFQGIEAGVSANLCEALASMSPSSTQASLEIGISWSRTRPRVPEKLLGQVSFAQGEFAIIQEAGRRLRERAAPKKQRIEGMIIKLQAEPTLFEEEFEGVVFLRGSINGQSAPVRFVLGKQDYALACDAHRDGRRISVVGLPHRDAGMRFFELLHAEQFQVLAETSSAN